MSEAREKALERFPVTGMEYLIGEEKEALALQRWGFAEGWDAALAERQDLPDRETLRDALAGWPIGRGYYQTTVAADEAGEMADAVLALLRGETP